MPAGRVKMEAVVKTLSMITNAHARLDGQGKRVKPVSRGAHWPSG